MRWENRFIVVAVNPSLDHIKQRLTRGEKEVPATVELRRSVGQGQRTQPTPRKSHDVLFGGFDPKRKTLKVRPKDLTEGGTVTIHHRGLEGAVLERSNKEWRL